MSKNRLLWLMFALVLTPVAFCGLSGMAVYAEKQQAYRQDVDDLLTIAAALGYTPDHYLGNYRSAGGNTPEVIVVIYYSNMSWEQFTSQVLMLGFDQSYYYHDDEGNNQHVFDVTINRFLSHHFGKVISINDDYLDESTQGGSKLEPVVTTWMLQDARNRSIDIHYVQIPSLTDVWKYNGQVVPGSIVLISLDRRTDLFTQTLPYPELEVLIRAAAGQH